MVLFFMHIPFVVNHTINATPPERVQQQQYCKKQKQQYLKCLSNLSEEKIESGYRTDMIKGTLQMILSCPNGIILFSESTVRIYHYLARTDTVYVDVTGSVLLGDKSCYAYEIVVRHPNQGNPPLAVASYFATSHNIYHPFPTFSNHFATEKHIIQKKISAQVGDVRWEHSTNECDCTLLDHVLL